MAEFGNTTIGLLLALLGRLGFKPRHTLRQQIKNFAEVGVTLNPGVTIDDLEHSFSNREYEADPYRLLFFVLGSEVERTPWGRRISNQVWNFDLECVEGPGRYQEILRNLAELVGRPELISEIAESIGPTVAVGELSYCIDGNRRTLGVRVQDDWADADAVASILRDIENTLDCGRRFWSADHGQVAILTFLTAADAKRINALCGGLLRPI
jgi:hypothetical protein